jgi:hypothetical protein
MKALIGLLIPLLLTSPVIAEDMNATNLKGYQFSLLDIEKNCVAQRDGVANTLSIECKGANLNPVRRSCEGYINGGLENVKLTCSGGLWMLNTRCKIMMRGAKKGEFNCKI